MKAGRRVHIRLAFCGKGGRKLYWKEELTEKEVGGRAFCGARERDGGGGKRSFMQRGGLQPERRSEIAARCRGRQKPSLPIADRQGKVLQRGKVPRDRDDTSCSERRKVPIFEMQGRSGKSCTPAGIPEAKGKKKEHEISQPRGKRPKSEKAWPKKEGATVLMLGGL